MHTKTKKLAFRTLKLLLIVYLLLCTALYFLQEKIVFAPQKLDKNFSFRFAGPFEELSIKATDGVHLNALHFKANDPKGLIVYLHGNAGSLANWGESAPTYTALGFDVLMPDYRGYGKSGGAIRSRQQLFSDVQAVYSFAKKLYAEDSLVILGCSIGTGMAAWLAVNNHPKSLILQAPYYSLADAMHQHYPFVPSFLLKYNFKTFEYLDSCTSPVTIFHGDADNVFSYTSSERLKNHFKPGDTLIVLSHQGHNNITVNPQYLTEMKRLLVNR